MKNLYFKILSISFFIVLIFSSTMNAQNNNLGIGTSTPDASAMLDILSSNKGLLVPRMTATERLAIPSPANALIVYDTDSACLLFYKQPTSEWVSLCTAGPQGPQGIQGLTGADGAQGISVDTAIVQNDTLYITLSDFTIINAGYVKGDQGLQGVPGLQGLKGDTGATGLQGATGLLTSGASAGNTPYWNGSSWVTNSSNIFNNAGNVGIGTTTPVSDLQINDHTVTGPTYLTLATSGINASPSDVRRTSGIKLMHFDNKNYGFTIESNSDTAFVGLAIKSHFNDSVGIERVYIDRFTGNVGIGTAAPTQKLDVNGVITATGGNSTEWNNKLDAEIDADTTNELQQLSFSGDTIFISKTNYILLPGLKYLDNIISLFGTVQERLNKGETPKQLFDNGIPLDSLYGKTYQGGLIAYLNTTTGTGIIAAPIDQSTGALWGCYGTPIAGADGVGIGTGEQNTLDIEAGCTTTGIAADICANLTFNSYSDWFLPSRDELNQLYFNLKVNGFGSFANMPYWSSTEASNISAWTQYFANGSQANPNKGATDYVRAVRAF